MSLGKYFSQIKNIADKKGFSAALDWTSQHADPAVRWSFNEGKKIKIAPNQGRYSGILEGLQRGVRTSTANTALYLKTIKDKGLGRTILDQVKSDLYREVELGGKNVLISKNGKEYLKSRNIFGLGDREVLGKTGRDSVIVRKREVLTPLSLAGGVSGASMGAYGYYGSPADTVMGKLKDATVEGTLFGLNPAVGTAYLALK